MIPDFEISDIHIFVPRVVQVSTGFNQIERQLIDIHVTLKNHSRETSYYVLSKIRKLSILLGLILSYWFN